ncbi:E3 SUMO-protein ligase PIAS4-A-like [Denticeps clupeoides]|uniref:E3 SUMO-protein ligase PIAS4-A-like n=1 Tax=Denticeps clupeoides TaxID=299321 RepID=UPI0010A2C082|nr:E3 SUMO-protein ligase PIAS4-A-like [Denticeps clupeoides]
MVESLRVTELRALLSAMGQVKTGPKRELLQRVLRLVGAACGPELLGHIQQQYSSRQAAKTPGRTRGRRSGAAHPEPVPAVKMIDLPFYQALDTLVQPTALGTTNSHTLHRRMVWFVLNETHREQIKLCRSRGSDVQVVIRTCYTECVGIEEDQYPPNFSLVVNEEVQPVTCRYPSNKPGVEPCRPCIPVDVTSSLNLCDAQQSVSIFWGDFGKSSSPCQRYSFAVLLVRVLSAEELLTELRKSAVERADQRRSRICKELHGDPESEITTTRLCVALTCPLAKMRLSVPCSAASCAHLQCFDALFYLQMNKRKPTWTCPVCDKPAPFSHLVIDGLLSEILDSTDGSVEEIEYLADGSWRPVGGQEDQELSRRPLCHNAPAAGASVTATGGAVIVDLTQYSSDEDASFNIKGQKCIPVKRSRRKLGQSIEL